jgi:hypothetical protein
MLLRNWYPLTGLHSHFCDKCTWALGRWESLHSTGGEWTICGLAHEGILQVRISRPECETKHSLPSSAWDKCAWSNTTTRSYFSALRCLTEHRENFVASSVDNYPVHNSIPSMSLKSSLTSSNFFTSCYSGINFDMFLPSAFRSSKWCLLLSLSE